MGLFFSVIEYLVTGTCALSFGLVTLTILGFFRNLPAEFTFLRRALSGFLKVSILVYRPVLSGINTISKRYVGIDLLHSYARIVVTTSLSLLIVLLIFWAFKWRITTLSIVLSIFHGILVGVVWDAPRQADGLRLGEKLE